MTTATRQKNPPALSALIIFAALSRARARSGALVAAGNSVSDLRVGFAAATS